MGSVDDFLYETMLASANRGVFGSPLLWDSPKYPLRPPPKPDPDTSEEDAAIWNYGPPVIGGGVHLKNLTCRARGMDYDTMVACDSIEWAPVTVTLQHTESQITLPLETKFQLSSHFLAKGKLTGNDRWWKLPAKTDQSFEVVFGYEFPDLLLDASKVEPRPLSKDGLQSFAPHGLWDLFPASVFDIKASDSNTLRIPPLRILVVVTLVCCKELDDFDPGGLLGAGRFFPMTMVAANHELKTFSGKIVITRPEHVTMLMEDGKICKMSNGPTITMDDEEMTTDLGAAFFTDRNSRGLPTDWAQLFDYYDGNPSLGSYVLAWPWTAPAERTSGVKVTASDIGPHNVIVSWPRSVTKVSGQGEFDNIHVAPRMIIRRENLTCSMLPAATLQGLDRITMAPFCIHDCMHLHTRWGKTNTNTSNCGWKDDATPNAMPGAPMVPANQKVTLNLLTACSFEYIVEATDARSGMWHIMLHHGIAYALSTGVKAGMARRALNAISSISVSKGPWAELYWNYRWGVGRDRDTFKSRQFERLSWAPGVLEQLRELGSQPVAKAQAAGQTK